MKFFLGTHRPYWLWKVPVPLFVSRRQLCQEPYPKPTACDWALDSGGFTELKDHGRWTISAKQYVEEVRRWSHVPGRLAWAPVMDWMCEPTVREGGVLDGVRFAGTGLSVREHQRRTLASWFELRALAPELPWVPVLQGYSFGDYLRHAEDYAAVGVDLASLPLTGLGSVCRRQNTGMVEDLIRTLARSGIRLHAFGFKTLGLQRAHLWLESADSMAWSRTARADKVRLPGCEHRAIYCNNCLRWALRWRDKMLASLEARHDAEPGLFDGLSVPITGCAAPASLPAPGTSASSGLCSGSCPGPHCSGGGAPAAP